MRGGLPLREREPRGCGEVSIGKMVETEQEEMKRFSVPWVDVWERALNLGTELSCRTLHFAVGKQSQTFADSKVSMLPRLASAPLDPVPGHIQTRGRTAH